MKTRETRWVDKNKILGYDITNQINYKMTIANSFAAEPKYFKMPSYSDVRPHLVQPAKDLIKVINATCPKISTSGISLGCK
jgi:hypothetical protein